MKYEHILILFVGFSLKFAVVLAIVVVMFSPSFRCRHLLLSRFQEILLSLASCLPATLFFIVASLPHWSLVHLWSCSLSFLR
ncbi:uncharacterized protein DS421_19g645200 [Arachis hypogaea]|uniref:Uncharacterized protein n=1 Tax=Arachis hypogaea TaxID=3818 RepID=A0A6B9V5H9_ARAHY|nr:uncharacterized protein DS421_19g645200 [Arachis hypogaea]